MRHATTASILLLGLALLGSQIFYLHNNFASISDVTETLERASVLPVGSTQKYGRNRKVVLLGPHDRFNFGDLLFAKVVSRLLVTRAGYSPDEILHGGIVSIDMTRYGGPPTVLSMRTIQDMSRSAKEPYDIVYTGGEAMGCSHDIAKGMMMTEELREQATREHIHDCAYLFPKRLLLPENNTQKLTNYAVINSLGGKTANACKEAEDTADYVAYRMKDPLYPDSAVMTKELYPDEIERAAKEALEDLGFADDQKFVAVQKKPKQGGKVIDDSELQELALVLDQVARGMNAKVVFFSAGTAPGHDSFHMYEKLKSFMKEDAIVYRGAHVWKVVGLVSRASAIFSTSLHVRIMAFIHFKPRVTWCSEGKHEKFMQLWDTKESAPCFEGITQTWDLLQSRYLSDPDHARETTAARYNEIVHLYLESFAKYSTLLRPPIEE